MDHSSNRKNIFIEGIQGSGKSTLVQRIHEWHPEYAVCREGDYSPVELAWCTWMSPADYRRVLEQYEPIRDEIRQKTVWEQEHAIVQYTRIITDIPGFHKDLERYEIYNGRKSLDELETIVRGRYERFRGKGYLFECSFFQNIVEDLILFQVCSDEEIVDFYRRLFEVVDQEQFSMIYLQCEDLETSIRHIRRERADAQGRELWYPLMMEFLRQSPYGMKHGYQDFDDLVGHFKHRQSLELRIIREVLGEHVLILPAKQWSREMVEKALV